MSRKANPTLIGLFIVLGLFLVVGGILLFSSSRLFTHTKPCILYFDASLTGLDPGSAVRFRGVTVGYVKEVRIHFNQAPDDFSLPVLIELNERLLRERGDESFNLAEDHQLESSIHRGLRARLESQSLLTGLLYVELDFMNPVPPAIYHQVRPLYTEIPTAHSEVPLFQADFAGITRKLDDILTKLNAGLDELRIREIQDGLTNLLAAVHAAASSPELTNSFAAAHLALDEVRLLSATLRAEAGGIADAVGKTLVDSSAAMDEVRKGVADVRDLLAPQASFRRDLDEVLGQLSRAARSTAELAEYLKRNPNALLSGRKTLDQPIRPQP